MRHHAAYISMQSRRVSLTVADDLSKHKKKHLAY